MLKELGYSPEQAELLGQMDDLFEEAIKLELLDPKDAIVLGQVAGTIMGRKTGKPLGPVQAKVFVGDVQVV
jgi:hypothetical protein